LSSSPTSTGAECLDGGVGRCSAFAGELKALLAAGVEPSLDLEAWSQFFAYEGALSGHSPLEGVALLGGATRLEISRGRKKAHTRWRYRLEPEASAMSRSGRMTLPNCSTQP
jgi:hypothetical protein